LTRRRLIITVRAARDIRRRETYLGQVRSEDVAQAATDALLTKLEKLARAGAQLGTTLGDDPAVRSFGYAKQATIIARFTPGEIRVLRVFFTGKDWTRGSRRR
jgi:plasmid stabilization system protein ParE